MESSTRIIGGGIWDGEDVIITINDTTKELDMIFMGKRND